MKTWRQLIALNLVLVLLLSLFPGYAFAVEDEAAEPAQIAEETVAPQMPDDPPATPEPTETPDEPEPIESPDADPQPSEITLRPGQSCTFRKLDYGSYPNLTIETQDKGLYCLHFTLPEALRDYRINANYDYGNDGGPLNLEVSDSEIPRIQSSDPLDFIYPLDEDSQISMRLYDYDDVDDGGRWAVSLEYLEPRELVMGETLGAGVSGMQVYSFENPETTFYRISSSGAGEYSIVNLRYPYYPGKYVPEQGYLSNSYENLRLEEAGEGLLLFYEPQDESLPGFVLEPHDPEGDFGAKEDNLHWAFSPDTGTLTISGSGSMGILDGKPWNSVSSAVQTLRILPGVTDVADYAFEYMEMEKVFLPEGLQSIGEGAFSGTRFQEITFPDSLKQIGANAFSNSKVTSFRLPAEVSEIGSGALSSRALLSVTVDSQNPNIMAVDDVLYSIDGKRLICCACTKHGPLILPDTVERIEDQAFAYCEAIVSIFIPAGVNYLGYSSSFQPKQVCFGGTEAQWPEIDQDNTNFQNRFVRFECEPSDCHGTIWQMEVTEPHEYDVQQFTPQVSGVYELRCHSPSGIDCFSNVSSSGNMSLYVSKDENSLENLGDWGEKPAYWLHAGETYDLQLIEGYVASVLPMEETGAFTFSAQQCNTFQLQLGETAVYRDTFTMDYAVFTASEDGYYEISVDYPDGNSSSLNLWSEGPKYEIDSQRYGTLLRAGQTMVVSIRFYGREANYTVEKLDLGGTFGENLTWSISDDGVFTVSGTGRMPDYTGYPLERPWEPYTSLVREIRFEEGITYIGANACSGMRNAESVEFPQTLREIGSDAFLSDESLKTVEIPGTVERIGESAFAGCESLESVTLSEGIREIGDWAFQGCALRETIELPASLEYFSGSAFLDTSVRSVTIPAENTFYVKENGMIFTADKTRLVYCDKDSMSGVVRIPENVQFISEHALSNCDLMTELVIPDSVTNLGSVWYCDQLQVIRVPQSVQEIGYLFYGNDALTDIYYAGDMIEWNYKAPGGTQNSDLYTYHFGMEPAADAINAGVHEGELSEETPYLAYCFTAPYTDLYVLNTPAGGEGMWLAKNGDVLETMNQYDEVTMSRYIELQAGEETYVFFKRPEGAQGSYAFSWSISDTKLPSLSLEKQTLGDPSGKMLCCFTPPVEGVYLLAMYAPWGAADVEIYDHAGHYVSDFGVYRSGSTYFRLHGGEQYYFAFSATGCEFRDVGVTITLDYAIGVTILGQPENQSAGLNQQVSFSVDAFGEDLTYQWYFRKAGASKWSVWSGRTEATAYGTANSTWDGMEVRCVVTDGEGNQATSDTAVFTLVPVILTQPSDSYPHIGDKQTISVSASGKDLTYQWYFKKVNDTKWTLWSGRTKDIAAGTVNATWDGMEVRCVVTGGNSQSVTSESATIHVMPLIITQPRSIVTSVGAKESFSVVASGNHLHYQWYVRKTDNSRWSAWTGKTTAGISGTVNASWNGMEVRCVITDANGRTLTSDVATVTFLSAPKITAHPENVSAYLGDQAAFSVEAEGENLTYQWYFKKANDTKWTLWSGRTAATAAGTVNTTWDGMQVRCVVTDANGQSTTSFAATVSLALKITSQPENVSAYNGDQAAFSVAAQGSDLSYQWYFKKAGASKWSVWSGRTEATAAGTVNTTWDGMLVRCVVTDGSGKSVTSAAAKITLALKIVTQPKSVTAAIGEHPTFTVEAQGTDLTYQWYFRKAGATKWSLWSGRTEATATGTVNSTWQGMQVRCVVTDGNGKTVTTNAVTVTIP